MYENGVPVDSMKVIVGMTGKRILPTPLIASIIHYVTFNPYWNVPDHLVRKTIAPNDAQGRHEIFQIQGYEVMADWTANSAVIPAETSTGRRSRRARPDPHAPEAGPDNSMGDMKFPFPNPRGHLPSRHARPRISSPSRRAT